MEEFFNTLDLDTQVELIEKFSKGSKLSAVKQLANLYSKDKGLLRVHHPALKLLQKLQKEFYPETFKQRVF
jgi:nicotinate-nucleotide pyrophosphorylase